MHQKYQVLLLCFIFVFLTLTSCKTYEINVEVPEKIKVAELGNEKSSNQLDSVLLSSNIVCNKHYFKIDQKGKPLYIELKNNESIDFFINTNLNYSKKDGIQYVHPEISNFTINFQDKPNVYYDGRKAKLKEVSYREETNSFSVKLKLSLIGLVKSRKRRFRKISEFVSDQNKIRSLNIDTACIGLRITEPTVFYGKKRNIDFHTLVNLKDASVEWKLIKKVSSFGEYDESIKTKRKVRRDTSQKIVLTNIESMEFVIPDFTDAVNHVFHIDMSGCDNNKITDARIRDINESKNKVNFILEVQHEDWWCDDILGKTRVSNNRLKFYGNFTIDEEDGEIVGEGKITHAGGYLGLFLRTMDIMMRYLDKGKLDVLLQSSFSLVNKQTIDDLGIKVEQLNIGKYGDNGFTLEFAIKGEKLIWEEVILTDKRGVFRAIFQF